MIDARQARPSSPSTAKRRAGGVARAAAHMGKVFALLFFGLVLAIYPVFLVLFTDKHSQTDYVIGLIMVGVGFAIVAGVAALLLRSWRYPFVLTLPATLVLIEYSRTETQQIGYHAAVFAVLLVSTAVSALVGARLRTRSRRETPAD